MKRLYPIGVKLYSENGYSDFRFTNYTNYAIDEYIEQFVVLNETFKYSQKTAGLQTISNMINHLCKTNTDMPNAIKFVMTSNYRGLLQYDGQAIPINSNLTINSLTGFEYFVDSTITETYLEKIQYTVYYNGKPDSKIGNITVLVGGEDCADCNGTSELDVKCIKCEEGFSFVEDDKTQCIDPVAFLQKNSNYFLDGNNSLRKCYENCGKCSAKKSTTGVYEHHNCITCDINHKFFVEAGNYKNNCYASCTEKNLYELEGKDSCSDECPATSLEYKYTSPDNHKYCLNDCGKADRNYAKYKLKDSSAPNLKQCVDACPDEYNYYGDSLICIKECTEPFPYKIDGENKCTKNCKILGMYINEATKQCENACLPDWGILINNNTCVEHCPIGIELRDDDTGICVSECKEGQFYDEYKKQCKTKCDFDSLSIPEAKLCISSQSGVVECSSDFPYKLSDQKICVSKCNYSNYFLIDEIKKECLTDCSNSNSFSVNQYRNTCVINCPMRTIKRNNTCVYDLQFGSTTNSILSTEYSKSDLDPILHKDILNLYDIKSTIKGKDFILQVYSTDSPFNELNDVSSIDFSKCETIIRNYNNYTGKIIISKIDTYSEGFISNKIEYKTYTEEGSEIDLLPCEGIESLVTSPYNDSTTICFDEGKELSKKGYDIFNSNDILYNDICGKLFN